MGRTSRRLNVKVIFRDGQEFYLSAKDANRMLDAGLATVASKSPFILNCKISMPNNEPAPDWLPAWCIRLFPERCVNGGLVAGR